MNLAQDLLVSMKLSSFFRTEWDRSRSEGIVLCFKTVSYLQKVLQVKSQLSFHYTRSISPKRVPSDGADLRVY